MAKKEKIKKDNLKRRQGRARAKVFGTAQKPRLNVFRSLKHVYVQLIDDQKGATLASAKDTEVKAASPRFTRLDSEPERAGEAGKSKKINLAKLVGELIAAKAKKLGVKEAVFDRAGRKYHGRVKAVADGARAGGLKF